MKGEWTVPAGPATYTVSVYPRDAVAFFAAQLMGKVIVENEFGKYVVTGWDERGLIARRMP